MGSSAKKNLLKRAISNRFMGKAYSLQFYEFYILEWFSNKEIYFSND